MTLSTNNIRSIGSLVATDGIILTPVFFNNMFPVKIKITKKEFDNVKHNIELMKGLAITKLNTK